MQQADTPKISPLTTTSILTAALPPTAPAPSSSAPLHAGASRSDPAPDASLAPAPAVDNMPPPNQATPTGPTGRPPGVTAHVVSLDDHHATGRSAFRRLDREMSPPPPGAPPGYPHAHAQQHATYLQHPPAGYLQRHPSPPPPGVYWSVPVVHFGPYPPAIHVRHPTPPGAQQWQSQLPGATHRPPAVAPDESEAASALQQLAAMAGQGLPVFHDHAAGGRMVPWHPDLLVRPGSAHGGDMSSPPPGLLASMSFESPPPGVLRMYGSPPPGGSRVTDADGDSDGGPWSPESGDGGGGGGSSSSSGASGVAGAAPGPARSYRCPMPKCARSFRRMEHLKRHIRIHTGEKPYPCLEEGCHKSFSRADNLSQHMRTHQERALRLAAEARNANQPAGTPPYPIQRGNSAPSLTQADEMAMSSTSTPTSPTGVLSPTASGSSLSSSWSATSSIPPASSSTPFPQFSVTSLLHGRPAAGTTIAGSFGAASSPAGKAAAQSSDTAPSPDSTPPP